MEEKLAKEVAMRALNAISELADILPTAKSQCNPSEYQSLLKAIGSASATICTNVLHPVFKEHPDVEKELGEKIKKDGRLL